MKHAVRQLLHHPAFTIVAVLSLALGIGVNTMMFSFFNGYLLRPVPGIKEPHRITELQRGDSSGQRSAFSWQEYEAFQEHNDVFSQLAAFSGPHGGCVTLSGGPDADDSTALGEEVRAKLVSDNFFSTLGVEAALGRTFQREDTPGAGSPPVVVLSHSLWQRRFGADPSVVGKTVKLNRHAFTVIGVTPKNFSGLGDGLLVTDAWMPATTLVELEGNAVRAQWQKEFRFQLTGRLKPGLTVAQAASALNALAAQLVAPLVATSADKWWLNLKPAGAFMSLAENTEVMLPIMTAVGLILLIACANVANLHLARAADRQKELGIRLALGAGRSRTVRQLLTESMCIALLGGAGGLLLGVWACRVAWNLRGAFLPPDVQLAELELSPDLRVFSYTLLLSLGTGIIVGLVPALEASRANLTSALKDEGVYFGRRVSRSRLRHLFAILQIAFCLSLLVGAGLLLRAGQKASTVKFPYRTQDILLARFELRRHGYTPVRAAEFHRQLTERLHALPGVKSLCLARHTLAGREHVDTVSPDYFKTMGIPILRGRQFTGQDGRSGVPVVIVSQGTAQRLWGNEEPVGKRMTNAAFAPFAEVVGVARNTRNLYECLVNNARPSAALPNATLDDYLYLPHSAANPEVLDMQMLVQFEGDLKTFTAVLREQIQRIDATLLASVGPLTQELAGGFRLFRGLTGLAQLLGLVALTLAAMGLYGVMAYAVSQRTREIGIRMALGAEKQNVFGWVLGKGARLILLGLALGVPGGVMLSSYLAALLVGLSPTDPITFVGIAFFLGAVGLLACYIPARRATRVEPMVALRCE